MVNSMATRKLLVAALLLALPGCGKAAEDHSLELEQQKLNLEMARSQREQLAVLAEREKACVAHEEKNAAALDDIERRRSEALGLAKDAEEKQNALSASTARANAELAEREKSLESREATDRATEQRNNDTSRDLDARDKVVAAKLALLQRQLAARAHQHAADAATREEELRPEIASRLKRRKPYLDQLAESLTDVAAKRDEKLVRSTFKKGLSDVLSDNGFARISDDREFAQQAAAAARDYAAKQICYFKYDFAFFDKALGEWKASYLGENQSQKAP